MGRGKDSGRADDQNVDVIRKRIKEYNDKTLPLRDYYSAQHKFYSVYGIGTIDEIFKRLSDTIENAYDFNKDLNFPGFRL